MDTRRRCNTTPNEKRWLFVGRDLYCPPLPEYRDDPSALFDEIKKVILLKVTALIALDDLYWKSSNYQVAAMMTIQVIEVLARPSRAVRVWASRTDLAYKEKQASEAIRSRFPKQAFLIQENILLPLPQTYFQPGLQTPTAPNFQRIPLSSWTPDELVLPGGYGSGSCWHFSTSKTSWIFQVWYTLRSLTATRGQVLGLDLWQVPRQDSACNTYVPFSSVILYCQRFRRSVQPQLKGDIVEDEPKQCINWDADVQPVVIRAGKPPD